MNNVITIGRRLIPLDQIAYIEPFDPSSATGLETTRKFEARVTLLNRDNLLAEVAMGSFISEHKFRLLELDQVALNPLLDYRVEIFEPRDDFNSSKEFKTRLLWRDQRGNDFSKLLVMAPSDVLAVVMEAETAPPPDAKPGEAPARSTRRRAAQNKRPARQPA